MRSSLLQKYYTSTSKKARTTGDELYGSMRTNKVLSHNDMCQKIRTCHQFNNGGLQQGKYIYGKDLYKCQDVRKNETKNQKKQSLLAILHSCQNSREMIEFILQIEKKEFDKCIVEKEKESKQLFLGRHMSPLIKKKKNSKNEKNSQEIDDKMKKCEENIENGENGTNDMNGTRKILNPEEMLDVWRVVVRKLMVEGNIEKAEKYWIKHVVGYLYTYQMNHNLKKDDEKMKLKLKMFKKENEQALSLYHASELDLSRVVGQVDLLQTERRRQRWKEILMERDGVLKDLEIEDKRDLGR